MAKKQKAVSLSEVLIGHRVLGVEIENTKTTDNLILTLDDETRVRIRPDDGNGCAWLLFEARRPGDYEELELG